MMPHVASKYLFENIDFQSDDFAVLKLFFNSINMSGKFVYGLSLMAEGIGFCFDEAYFKVPDREGEDEEMKFDGVMFGVYDQEVFVSGKDACHC